MEIVKFLTNLFLHEDIYLESWKQDADGNKDGSMHINSTFRWLGKSKDRLCLTVTIYQTPSRITISSVLKVVPTSLDVFLTKKIQEIRPAIEKQLEQDASIRLRMVTGDFRIEEMHENENREEKLARSLWALSEDDQEVINLLYGYNDQEKEYTEEEAAEFLGITREEVAKRHKEAAYRLKNNFYA